MFGKSLITLLLILGVSTSAALAAGSPSTSRKPAAADPYAKAVQAIKKKKFDSAIVLLRKVVKSKPSDADAWNQLGFSYRKTDRLELNVYSTIKTTNVGTSHFIPKAPCDDPWPSMT